MGQSSNKNLISNQPIPNDLTKNLQVTSKLLEDSLKPSSALIDSTDEHIQGNVTDDENISMCLSQSFEKDCPSDNSGHNKAQNKQAEHSYSPLKHNYDPMPMETTTYLEQLEKKIDHQLDQCYLKLKRDIDDLLMFSKENAKTLQGGLQRLCDEEDIEARLMSLEPLQSVIYKDLCKSSNIGIEQEAKKIARAKTISIHMPRLLAFLGFDIRQLRVIIINMCENSFQIGIEKLTDWFNEILEEREGKWCRIWPRCISTSVFAEILVKYFQDTKLNKNNTIPVSVI